MTTFNSVLKNFSDLTPYELYDILQLRSEIFVVEQRCIFQDLDNKDKVCHHLMLSNEKLLGYARIVPPGISYAEMSIGRVVVDISKRRTGFGKVLMEAAIEAIGTTIIVEGYLRGRSNRKHCSRILEGIRQVFKTDIAIC